jgi:glycosyltransferase involved in cell wall biosynthesis
MPVRITKAKNIELAAFVVESLLHKGCYPRLVITGPPDPHSAESMHYYQSLLDLRGKLHLEKAMRFVYELQSPEGEPLLIDQRGVSELLRVSDVLFLPSHREGFGMPVLEAGLIGVPVVTSENIPAAMEIGQQDVYLFDLDAPPDRIASLILDQATNNASSHFRRKVRQNYSWERIFRNQIEPLLKVKLHD